MKKVKEKFLKLNPFGLFSCILSVRRFTHGRRWQGIEDFILIKKIQSGDTDAFEIIVRKYYQSIYLFCCRRLNGDPDTAVDITQDVFLKLLEKIQSVRKIGKFQNYLLTIAVNTCNNYTKTKGNDSLDDYDYGEEDSEEWDTEDEEALDTDTEADETEETEK